LPLATRLTGIIYRVASVRRANPADLIAGVGSQRTGGRWTPPGAFRAVYASGDEATALDEAGQQNLRLGVPIWMALPLVMTALEIDLEPVLDLTDGRVRRVLRVSRARMLAEPWWALQDRGQEALTQAIGRLARDHGFVGLLAPSAARRDGANAVVFPDRLAATIRLSIVNPDRLPPGPA
jgi:RES domain-containing protein